MVTNNAFRIFVLHVVRRVPEAYKTTKDKVGLCASRMIAMMEVLVALDLPMFRDVKFINEMRTVEKRHQLLKGAMRELFFSSMDIGAVKCHVLLLGTERISCLLPERGDVCVRGVGGGGGRKGGQEEGIR